MVNTNKNKEEDIGSLSGLIQENSLSKVPLLLRDSTPSSTNYRSSNSLTDNLLTDVSLNNSATDLTLEESFKNERTDLYCLFFLLGVTMLIPWNSNITIRFLFLTLFLVYITAVEFFTLKFKDSKYESSFQNYFASVSTTAQLLFLIYALATQRKSALYNRVLFSLVIMGFIFFAILVLTQVTSLSSEANFWIYLTLLALGSASAALLSSDTMALAALINPVYVQSTVAGQAFAGLGISVFQILLTWGRGTILPNDPNFVNQVLATANWYFSSAFITVLASLILYIRLDINSEYEKEACHMSQPANYDEESLLDSETTLWNRILNQLKLCLKLYNELPTWSLNIFNVFVLTLAVFPAITASIRSTSVTGFISNNFVVLHFITFNLGDLVGRMIPSNPKFTITNINTINMLTWSRWVLVPMFLLGNLHFGESASPPALPSWFASDVLFFLGMAVMSVSNGYLATCILIVGPTKVVDQQLRGTMASLLVLMMIAGLSFGSFVSFPLRATACLCNPF